MSAPQILIGTMTRPGCGISVREDAQREFEPADRWTLPLDRWAEIRSHAASVGQLSLTHFMERSEGDIKRAAADSGYFDAFILTRSDVILGAFKQLDSTFTMPDWHCPLLFKKPRKPGIPDAPDELLAVLTKYERNCHQFGFFEYRQLDSSRIIAVRHTARHMVAINEWTGEEVECWYDAQQYCVAKVLTDDMLALDWLVKIAKKHGGTLAMQFNMNSDGDTLG